MVVIVTHGVQKLVEFKNKTNEWNDQVSIRVPSTSTNPTLLDLSIKQTPTYQQTEDDKVTWFEMPGKLGYFTHMLTVFKDYNNVYHLCQDQAKIYICFA